jgi:endoribonuclease LACTB2
VSAITPAASVLLSARPGSHDVFAVKRGVQLKFFGGFWAFPGGRLDAADLALAGAAEPTPEALRIAACRELFEEAGVLIARPFLPWGEELSQLRHDLLDGRLSFAQLLAQRGLTIHADDFRHVGQLTTPPFSQVRFATTFFEAHRPPNQRAMVLPGELEQGRWVSAQRLLDDWHAGQCLLTPPAVTILQTLHGRPIDEAPERLGPLFRGRPGDVLPAIFFAPDVQAIPLKTAVLPPATHTTAFLVEEILIDPGAGDVHEQQILLDLLDARRQQNRGIRGIVLTHHHVDHMGAAAVCAQRYGAPIWAHPLTAERLPPSIRVDRMLQDGDRIELHGERLDVLHTPGHAPGHIALFAPQAGLLFAGDMVSTQTSIVIYPPEGDLAAYLDSLRRLRTLPARLLLPSHGLPSAQPHQVIDEALAHRAKREKQLLDALAAKPATIDQLTPLLYRGVPEELWRFARAQMLAGLIKLEREGRVRRLGEERWEVCS